MPAPDDRARDETAAAAPGIAVPTAAAAEPGFGGVTAALLLAALFPFALGYLLSYLFRAVNAIVAPNLVSEVGLAASELGLLTAAYLASFAVFQLPLGVLLDRYGPRRVQAWLVGLGALGSGLFAIAESALALTLARALIGIAFSGGLMAGFKAVVIWVPEPRRALANACIMSLGGLGLLIATTPLELAVQALGWRAVFLLLAGATLATALIIWLVVPERASSATSVAPLREQVRQVGRIYRDRIFLAMAPLLATTAGTHIALQTLWAGPWFKDVVGLDRLGVANSLFWMAAGLAVSILGTGFVADRLARRGVSLLSVMMGFLTLYFLAQGALLLNPTDPWLALGLWCVFAMTGHVAVLAYPWFARYFGASLSGRSNTAINLVMFLWAFIAQFGVGAIIGLVSAPTASGYDPRAYQIAFGVFYAIQVLALLWYLAHARLIRAAQGG